jgi:hypothetical protein
VRYWRTACGPAVLPAVIVAACATHSPTALESVDPTVVAAAEESARTVELEELDNGVICERRVPTGSRISYETCYTREEQEARQAAMREFTQRDFEEMRQLQENRRLAEEEARRQIAQQTFGR